MGQHFTLGAGPVQIMGQHVLPRLYGCRRLLLPLYTVDPGMGVDPWVDKDMYPYFLKLWFAPYFFGVQICANAQH